MLAGGAALLAQLLTQRLTQDLDFFARPGAGDVARARAEFERVQDGPSFCRLRVHGDEDLIVDIAPDPRPLTHRWPASPDRRSPPGRLAGRKVIALFDRAAARDFLDVFALASRFSKAEQLARAAEIDAGFEEHAFAGMLAFLDRYRDAALDLGGADIEAMRAFFRIWAAELRANLE